MRESAPSSLLDETCAPHVGRCVLGGAVSIAGLVALVCLSGCGGANTNGFFFPDGGSDGANGGGNGGNGATSNDGKDGSAPIKLAPTSGEGGSGTVSDGDCPASAKLVYVTGEGSKLYSFYPPTFDFTLIGTLTCLGQEYSPTHMTVDRTGTAWVAAWDDTETSSLFTASTANAQCTLFSKWTPEPNGNFSDFALTFIGTTSATDTTLYMLGSIGGGLGGGQAVLGAFDTLTGNLTTVGMPNVASPGGDMTTNGDGTLYYLQDTTQLALYEINPANAQVLKTLSPSPKGGGDQALAFYGGYFYAFENNVVYQFDPTTQQTTKLGNAPLSVTGAGQSTCVPMTPPGSK